MNNNLPDDFQAASATGEGHSKVGIASFILSLLGVLAVAIMIGSFFSESYWQSGGNNIVDGLGLQYYAVCFTLIGLVLGITSMAEKRSKKVFAILGVFMGGLTILSCCFLFGLIFLSGGGFGG